MAIAISALGPAPSPLRQLSQPPGLGRKLGVRPIKQAAQPPNRPIDPIGLPEVPKTGISKPKARSAGRRSRRGCRRSHTIRGHKGQKLLIGAQTAVIGGHQITQKAYLGRKVASCGR